MTDYEIADKLFRKSNKFIISIVDEEGYPQAKCVGASKMMNSLEEMYFVTNTNSRYAQRLMKSSKASVYFFNGLFYKGCLLKGDANIVDDMEIKSMLWMSGYKACYPHPELEYKDPDFCVVKFVAKTARLYSDINPRDFELKK